MSPCAENGAPRPPVEQWWTINGQELMNALTRAHGGDVPAIVYLELLANSDGTDYGTLHDLDDVASEFGIDLNDDRDIPPGME